MLSIVSSYHVKTIKWRKWPKQYQMFARACIPKNKKPARKHGAFTNVPAFRIYATCTRVRSFVHVRAFLKKTFILNHPVVTSNQFIFIFCIHDLFYLHSCSTDQRLSITWPSQTTEWPWQIKGPFRRTTGILVAMESVLGFNRSLHAGSRPFRPTEEPGGRGSTLS